MVRYEVASGPELFLGNRFLGGELIVNTNGTFALEESDDGRNTMLRWDSEHQVHVVRLDCPFDDLDTLLPGKLSEHLSKDCPSGTKENLLAVFGCEDNVIDAIPPYMGLRVECVAHSKERKKYPCRSFPYSDYRQRR